jgi:hypothetical protein
VLGQAINKTLAPGSEITLVFTFFDDDGNSVGTADVDVALSDPDVAHDFQISFSGDMSVLGYSYESGS